MIKLRVKIKGRQPIIKPKKILRYFKRYRFKCFNLLQSFFVRQAVNKRPRSQPNHKINNKGKIAKREMKVIGHTLVLPKNKSNGVVWIHAG